MFIADNNRSLEAFLNTQIKHHVLALLTKDDRTATALSEKLFGSVTPDQKRSSEDRREEHWFSSSKAVLITPEVLSKASRMLCFARTHIYMVHRVSPVV